MDDGVWIKVEFFAGNHAGYWERVWVDNEGFAALFESHPEGENLDAEVDAAAITAYFDLPPQLTNDVLLTVKYEILE